MNPRDEMTATKIFLQETQKSLAIIQNGMQGLWAQANELQENLQRTGEHLEALHYLLENPEKQETEELGEAPQKQGLIEKLVKSKESKEVKTKKFVNQETGESLELPIDVETENRFL